MLKNKTNRHQGLQAYDDVIKLRTSVVHMHASWPPRKGFLLAQRKVLGPLESLTDQKNNNKTHFKYYVTWPNDNNPCVIVTTDISYCWSHVGCRAHLWINVERLRCQKFLRILRQKDEWKWKHKNDMPTQTAPDLHISKHNYRDHSQELFMQRLLILLIGINVLSLYMEGRWCPVDHCRHLCMMFFTSGPLAAELFRQKSRSYEYASVFFSCESLTKSHKMSPILCTLGHQLWCHKILLYVHVFNWYLWITQETFFRLSYPAAHWIVNVLNVYDLLMHHYIYNAIIYYVSLKWILFLISGSV